MDWFLIFIVYLIMVIALASEGQSRLIGGWKAFLVSTLLTPVIGFLFVAFSRKKITFHHFVKLNNENIDDQKIMKTLKTDGQDHWVEIKTSELSIL